MQSPPRRRPDDVAEHGAGFDRRELLGVSDDDQARVGTQRLEQPGHHGQRHHGGLVDDDDVVAQRVRPVVPEPGPVAAAPPEEPVKRRSAELEQPRPRCPGRGPDGSPRCGRPPRAVGAALPVGAARAMSGGGVPRATACWSSSASRRATVVVFPVPGPPAMTETRRRTAAAAARGCRWSGSSDSGSASVNSCASPVAQKCQVDVDRLGPGPRQELCGDQAFIEPEPIQVQVRSGQVERVAIPDERALGHCVEPSCGFGPGQCVDVGRQVDVSAGGLSDGLQVDAHVAESRRPDGEGDPEADVLARRRRRVGPAGAPRGRLSRPGSPLG